jgi:hypothetical protein
LCFGAIKGGIRWGGIKAIDDAEGACNILGDAGLGHGAPGPKASKAVQSFENTV